MRLVRTIEIRHRLIALVEKDESSSESLFGKSADMLIHASLRSSQEPKNSLDHKVGNEPAQSALRNCPMYIRGFKEVGDETVNRKASAKGFAKYLESAKLLGE